MTHTAVTASHLSPTKLLTVAMAMGYKTQCKLITAVVGQSQVDSATMMNPLTVQCPVQAE